MKANIEEREKIVQTWLDDLAHASKLLIGKTGIDLENSLRYTEDVAGFAIPIANDQGQWGLSHWPARYETYFYLVPLLPEDAELHDYFKYALKTATFHEGMRAVFLPPWEMSRTWRAVILSHELMHTIAYKRGWHRRKKLGYWAEEAEIYRAETHLVRRLYGRKYNDAVIRLSKKFAPAIKAKDLGFKDKEVVPDATIERIFGIPKSDYERSTQGALLILDALYHALDRLYVYGGRKHDMHCRTITFWYCNPKGYTRWKESSSAGRTPKKDDTLNP